MCGIAGVLYADPLRPVDEHRLTAMARAIGHRGPDGCGIYVAPSVGLVHRRLSIIDLAGGTQPLANEDETIWVVFNGEIYNYRELRSDLEARGHGFKTSSDTETLVHLYEEHGEALVHRLRGMFAFAIWDQRKQQLLLARDRVGIKPLYYRFTAQGLVFASELKAILAHGDAERTIDASALDEYLAYGMIGGTRSIFRDIKKLAPGHTLSVSADRWRAEPKRYWQLAFRPDHARTVTDWKEAIRAKLEECVRLHLIADVPVGAFLSGGIDSTVITAMAAQQTADPIQTFSMGFAESRFNELPFARQAAESMGTQHFEEVVAPDAVSLLDQLCWHYDEPFADSSAIPSMLVAQLASQRVKVVLSGDGGDEAFGGYRRYQHDLGETHLRHLLPRIVRKAILPTIARAWPKADWLPRYLRAKTALTNLSLDDADAYANTLSLCRLPLRHRLLSADVVGALGGDGPEAAYREAFVAGGGDVLAGMIATDVATYLPNDYLVKVDRASMAFGLEVRPPLLDHELLELTATIPSKWKIHGGETKWIFKETCDDLLPAGLRRRPKQGFEIPIDTWLRGPLQDVFRAKVMQRNGSIASLLHLNEVEKAFQAHQRGTSRLGSVLWELLVLACWCERFMCDNWSAPPRVHDVEPVRVGSRHPVGATRVNH